MKLTNKKEIVHYLFIASFMLLFISGQVLDAGTSPKKSSLRTGVFLSLGHTNYSFQDFDENPLLSVSSDPGDLFLGLSVIYKNHAELNLVYNRSTEGFSANVNMTSYDKDGLGLELGGIIPVHLFNKNTFDVSLEFVGGGYGILYLSKRVHSGIDPGSPNFLGDQDASSFYQAGFYWAIRLRYLISGKASFELGYKSMLPVKSNEFLYRTGKESLIFKTFFTLGLSF